MAEGIISARKHRTCVGLCLLFLGMVYFITQYWRLLQTSSTTNQNMSHFLSVDKIGERRNWGSRTKKPERRNSHWLWYGPFCGDADREDLPAVMPVETGNISLFLTFDCLFHITVPVTRSYFKGLTPSISKFPQACIYSWMQTQINVIARWFNPFYFTFLYC